MNLGVNLGLDTGGKCSRCVSVCCRCGANCSIRCLFLLLFVSHGSSNQPRHKTHAMPYLRMVDVQTARWAEARIKGYNGDKEIRWREGLKLKQDGRITKVYVHLASTRMTCEDVSVWCIWFTEQHALLQKHGGAQVVMEKADFSRNQIGNRGLSILVADVFARFVPQQLLLFGNKISDVSPLEKLLAMGTLRELHLSNNELSAYAVCQVVVVAASAKDQSGKYFYPIQGLKPLWLRLENNTVGEDFHFTLAKDLCKAGRTLWKAICFVDGTTGCNPSQCHCGKEHIPAIHLTYFRSSLLNSRRAVNKSLGRNAMPMQKPLNKQHNKPL